MLKQLQQAIVQNLWERYRLTSPDIQLIEATLKQKNIAHPTLDHFAIIDLPGSHSGIPVLKQIFSAIHYTEQGKDYLADKQNDFLWMSEANCDDLKAAQVLPQVVVADFRLDEMPIEIKNIIYHYSQKAKPAPLQDIKTLAEQAALGQLEASMQCANLILNYLAGRDFDLPTQKEFCMVREFNELLAWVLVFGRRPNHFTLGVHLLPPFTDLPHFNHFIENEVNLILNQEGGVIKGGKETGIAQSSTKGIAKIIQLADGEIAIPTGFVEFVWRYPKNPANEQPVLWNEYFTGFVAKHADRVIESLYNNS